MKSINLPEYACTCCQNVNDASTVLDKFAHVMELLTRGIFNGDKYTMSREVYQETANHLTDAAVKGWSKVRNLDAGYNVPDYQFLTMLEANIHRFSAAKSVAMVNQMNKLLKQHQGSFQDFKKAVDGLNIQYNGNYLNSEYNLAIATGQAGGKWLRIQEEKKTFPYVRYRTIGDSNVREAHAKLNGKIFKVGSAELDIIAPPNGFNCRCELEQLTDNMADSHKEDIYDMRKTLDALHSTPGPRKGESEYDYMKRERFNVNRGKLQTVFTESQLYVRRFKEKALGVTDWGLTEYDNINQAALPVISPVMRSKEKALAWFASRMAVNPALSQLGATFIDFRSFPLLLTERSFKATLGASTGFVDFIGPILESPDEVWLVQDGNKYLYRYIRFYKGNPLMVEVQVGADEAQNIVWFGKIGERYVDKNWRNGVLLHSK